jgi:predicted flap endonuclease-1-like 5' DNA nuclease/peptidoglycan hydrolase CwlO-like protein
MPEITVILIAILAGSVAAGAVIGWIVRGSRCAQEKVAVNEGWQQQLGAQRSEHQRLLDQNKNLMEQVSQLQASGTDATNRARELSDALKEAFERRDQLQRELKEIRSNLELAVKQREQLQSDMKDTEVRGGSAQAALKEKDDKIFHLSRELENWQNRLPPLLERFRERDQEAARLEEDLETARARIDELENTLDSEETRVEPVDPESLGDELDASNDPMNQTQTGIADVLAADEDEDEDDATKLEAEIEATDEESATDDAEPDEIETSAVVTELNDHEPGGSRDNLKLIKGVGPAIEKTLNELGIFHFDQIAEMSEYEIDRVAKRLKGFRSRIYREDWIGQARDLQLQKSGT